MVEVNHWQGMQGMRNTAFREVHKNAWLKMVLVENKKRDKLWVVFCVHDDTDPFLEAYVDNKVAATHKPHWYMSLNNTLHITPTICPQDEEYEFVITLQTDVIRLTAPSWQLMIDWVETLRRKLLEMRILSPKENVYSKLPITKNVTLLPTRDPTSPLPLPPTEPAAIVPGVEPPPIFNYDIESTSAMHSGTSTSSSPSASSSSQAQSFTASSSITPNEMAAATIHPAATSSVHYEQLFLQSSANKVAVLKRAQRSVSNCEIPQNALQGGSSEPMSLMRRRSNSLMETNSPEDTTNSGKRLTLRAQQVSQLQKEIMHPGGVRLRLRRRDCVNSIALVDACSGVWITGWKQKEHPMLYNALHIGDQLISVEGVAITKASDAHRIWRNASTGLFVELVVKRLPFGQVYAIRRDVEGQCLGLVQEDGSAVLKDVLPDGLAARHGLFPKAQTIDGLSLTNWVLTEINGRPLNLFFKDNEHLGMVKLIVLNISNNGVSYIKHDTFTKVKSLKIVNLSYNRLHSIPQDLFETNTLLNSLNLAGNQFSSLEPGPFLKSESLQILNISRSLIPYFYPDNFSNLPRLSTLDISQNVLIQIELQHFQNLTHLKVLILSGNEWNCNSNMKKLVTFLKNNNVYFESPCDIMEKSQKMIAIPEEPSEEIDGWINDCDIELINTKNDTNTCTNICEWHHSLMLLIATFVCGALVGSLSLIIITSFAKMLKPKERNKLGEQYLMRDFNDCGLSTPVLNRIQRH